MWCWSGAAASGWGCQVGELPNARDGLRLRQVASELPAGTVPSPVLICRAPHRFPLGEGLDALPLGELTSHCGIG